ncbi:MAG: pyridoxamine 5'-phosphate oxidase family protein [Nitrospira sp.]|nr:pyridoxamine 5'-phosphate oxidase family protein [Nitrospira sp.]
MKKSEGSIPDRVKKGSAPVLERLNALDKDQLHAVLATESDGQPYTSMIAYAVTPDKKGIVFITPQKTRKYKSILKNNNVSILIDTRSNTEKDYMHAESLTILGNAFPVKKGRKWSELIRALIRKHPRLNEVIHSTETRLILVKIARCIHVSRFQTVSEWIAK